MVIGLVPYFLEMVFKLNSEGRSETLRPLGEIPIMKKGNETEWGGAWRVNPGSLEELFYKNKLVPVCVGIILVREDQETAQLVRKAAQKQL